MNIEWCQLGDKLVYAGSQCKGDVVLAAPFMKSETLIRIVSVLPQSASLLCLTRWRLEEIANGVSDLECWDVITRRGNSRLMLRSNLHAKYFRFDGIGYLGSANVTMAALGWSARPNVEALIEFRMDDIESAESFETNLFDGAVAVTPDLVAEFKAMLGKYATERSNAQSLQVGEAVAFDERNVVAATYWFPRSRSPEYLYQVYCGESEVMSREGLASAREDLLDFDVPTGLPEPAFVVIVRSRLASTPIVVELDQFLTIRRRFGEIRSWLAGQLGVTDATDEWQRLMRWLLFFLPDRYDSATPRYSELFGRRVTL